MESSRGTNFLGTTDQLLPIGPRLISAEELTGGFNVPGLAPQPAGFYPSNTPAPVNPVKQEGGGGKSALMYSWVNGSGAYSFSIGPQQLLGGKGGIDELVLRTGIWMRNWMVQFAIDVAGFCGAKDVKEMMMDPTSDLKAVLARATPVPMQLPRQGGAEAPFGLGPDGQMLPGMRPVPTSDPGDTGFQTAGFTEAMKTLEQVANAVTRFGSGTDALRVYDYLVRRQHTYDRSILDWLTLPQNLGRVFLTPEMSSAVKMALNDVAKFCGLRDDGQLFGEVLSSSAYTEFFQLVGARINLQRYNRQAGAQTKHKRIGMQETYDQLLLDIQQKGVLVGTRPDMPQDPDLSVEAMEESRGNTQSYDAQGRPVITLN